MKQNPKSPIQCKTTTPPFLIVIALVLACFALSPAPNAFGVVPAPDGGYPGFNTAEGQNALLHLTTGTANTAVGWFSLENVTTGSFNTGVGAGTLLFNIGNQDAGEGIENTAIGAAALLFNTAGAYNTANGAFTLFSNTSGSYNTANGHGALYFNTEGFSNTATGYAALSSNTIGDENTASGVFALFSNITGSSNTATGVNALSSNTDGDSNTAVGAVALVSNTTGERNTATGHQALFSNTEGGHNTAIGDSALRFNTTGGGNTAIGDSALFDNQTGSDNIALGTNAGANVSTASNVICIGTNVSGQDVSDSCYIGNIFAKTTSGGTAVFINSDGKLGTTTSSRRFKDEIKPMDKASEAILALKPVTFRYKHEIDPARSPQFGLVAEEVEKVNPDLVVRDAEGKVNTVRYEAVNAMLLNEFLKEHRKVEEQQATISQLKKGMETVVARLKEQASQIQKVSARLEARGPAPQVVLNNQ